MATRMLCNHYFVRIHHELLYRGFMAMEGKKMTRGQSCIELVSDNRCKWLFSLAVRYGRIDQQALQTGTAESRRTTEVMKRVMLMPLSLQQSKRVMSFFFFFSDKIRNTFTAKLSPDRASRRGLAMHIGFIEAKAILRNSALPCTGYVLCCLITRAIRNARGVYVCGCRHLLDRSVQRYVSDHVLQRVFSSWYFSL